MAAAARMTVKSFMLVGFGVDFLLKMRKSIIGLGLGLDGFQSCSCLVCWVEVELRRGIGAPIYMLVSKGNSRLDCWHTQHLPAHRSKDLVSNSGIYPCCSRNGTKNDLEGRLKMEPTFG